MLANLQWYGRIPEIRVALEASDSPFVNRMMIETLFGIPRRSAGRLLGKILEEVAGPRTPRKPGAPIEELLVPMEGVLAWLDEIERGEVHTSERHRRRDVAERLRQLRDRVREARQEQQDPQNAAAAEVRFQYETANKSGVTQG